MNKECKKCFLRTWKEVDCDICKTNKAYKEKVKKFEHDYLLLNEDIEKAKKNAKSKT